MKPTEQATLFSIIQNLIFISYPLAMMMKFGPTPSISDTWYKLKQPWTSLFTLWLWALTATMIVVFNFLENPLFFVSGVCLAFCGTAAAFRQDPMTRTVHFIGAGGGLGCALVALIITSWPLIILVVGAFTVAIRFFPHSKVWWIEYLCGMIVVYGISQQLKKYAEAIPVPEVSPEPSILSLLL